MSENYLPDVLAEIFVLTAKNAYDMMHIHQTRKLIDGKTNRQYKVPLFEDAPQC